METIFGICPICNKQIEVNTSESVDFCKLCGKAFTVQEAINIYSKNQKRIKAEQKLSREAVEKFNAILAQDYKLAQAYLNDTIRKVYPPECIELLYSSYKVIEPINPEIAAMRYKLLCKQVNEQYKNEYNIFLTGGLAELKLRLKNIQKQLREITSWITKSYYGEDSLYYKKVAAEEWEKLEKNITDNKKLCGKEFDDEFILSVIQKIDELSNSKSSFYGVNAPVSYGKYIRDFFKTTYYTKDRSLDSLIKLLEDFLSPAMQHKKVADKRIAEQKVLEDKAREKEEERFKIEVAFWQRYINLLKAGKTRKAFSLLKSKYKYLPYRYEWELESFKRVLFWVKYKGNISALKAENLAETSLRK